MSLYGQTSAELADFSKGVKRTIATGVIAGNVAINIAAGVGKRLKILRGRIYLDTDATVGDRYIQIITTDGTTKTSSIGYMGGTLADKTANLTVGEVRYVKTAVAGDPGGDITGYIGIDPIIIQGVEQLRITIAPAIAGDAVSVWLDVIEAGA